jgi:hypothetical protein
LRHAQESRIINLQELAVIESVPEFEDDDDDNANAGVVDAPEDLED